MFESLFRKKVAHTEGPQAPPPIADRAGAEALITGFYHEALGRAPDNQGLSDNVEFLLEQGTFTAAANIMAHFRHSPEAQAKRRLAKAADNTSYDHMISLGTHCASAWAIKSAEMRKGAYPFDWIFSNSAMILHCLRDDFATFLDPQYYALLPDGACQHRFYLEHFNGHRVFNHRSPLSEGGHDYYQRAVARFRKDVYGNSRSLLVMMGHDHACDLTHFAELAAFLEDHAPNASLLMISVREPGSDRGMGFEPATMIGRHRGMIYNAGSPLQAVDFADPIDNLMIRAALHRANPAA